MTRQNFITELGNKNSRSRDKSRTKGEGEGEEASLRFRHPRSQGPTFVTGHHNKKESKRCCYQ